MFNISNIKISFEKVLSRLDYSKSKTKLDANTERLIKEILSLASKLINPKSVLSFENILIKGGVVYFENGYKIESADIAKLLKNSFQVCGAAVTLGSALEKKRDDFLSQKETFNALILDAAGSVAAEEAAEVLYGQIKEKQKTKGFSITRRYSAGYGDWKLDGQKDFLIWLGADLIGIKLNESYLMNPEKSVSFLLGVIDEN